VTGRLQLPEVEILSLGHQPIEAETAGDLFPARIGEERRQVLILQQS
jgi:hypothetical protein